MKIHHEIADLVSGDRTMLACKRGGTQGLSAVRCRNSRIMFSLLPSAARHGSRDGTRAAGGDGPSIPSVWGHIDK